jgi:hypothetical protein
MVQASHLAISSPALLSFVRAYLWQLERTGKVPDSEDAEEQQAAKAAAQALYSTARSREQLWRLFGEFKQHVEQRDGGGAPSEQLRSVMEKLGGVPSEAAIPEPASAITDTATAIPDTASAITDSASAITDTASAITDTASAITDTASASVPSRTLQVPSRTLQVPSRTLRVPSRTLQVPSAPVQTRRRWLRRMTAMPRTTAVTS